jgi:CRP/FNR family transcriptional regulator, cyclic AMP receptor protein
MQTQGLRVVESSLACLTRKGRVFSDLSASALKPLDACSSPVNYPKGAVLFLEGQVARGIFVVGDGQVKLSISSRDGKVIILKIAQAGELMGLHATLSGKPYEVTAEVSEQAQVNFVPRSVFLRFLRMNSEAFMRIARLLMDTHYADYELIQSLGLSRTASEKLARLFLGWSARQGRVLDHFQISLTHEEIGEMIGVSRETVTRLLGEFKKRQLLAIKGAAVTICNRAALENLVGGEAMAQ